VLYSVTGVASLGYRGKKFRRSMYTSSVIFPR